MAKGFKHGTSGKKSENPLNFAVVAYPSEVELNTAIPEDTTITTVGVVTTNPITGWYFIAEQPENMAEGELWFSTAKSSALAFNALKKNNVTVYPVSAKQMVSGTLKEVTAKTYQGGEWVEWLTYLLNRNNKFEAITGGWTTEGFKYGSIGFVGSSYSDDGVVINAQQGAIAGVFTANTIDFSNSEKIAVVIETPNTTCNLRLITGKNADDTNGGIVASYTVDIDASGFGEVNISNISVKCHLGILPGAAALLKEVYMK